MHGGAVVHGSLEKSVCFLTTELAGAKFFCLPRFMLEFRFLENMKRIFILYLIILPALLLSAADLPALLQPYAKPEYWQEREVAPAISKETLVTAVEAARAYYLNHQLQEGNFLYAFDVVSNQQFPDDNQVRQAGALWGLSCLNRDRFTENTRRAVLAGLEFFLSNRKKLTDGQLVVTYPGDEMLKTGTVALFCLAVTDFLIGQEKFLPPEVRSKYETALQEQLRYLQSMELPDGSWAHVYDLPSGYRDPVGKSYYDGEALLAYCKAARYLRRDELLPRIQFALPKLIQKYLLDCWKPGGNAEETRGFSQWGAMAFAECVEAQWEQTDGAAEAALALGWWQIHSNKIEAKAGNTAYAVEGLIASWRVAKCRQDQASMTALRAVSERCLGRLMLCQIGGPFHTKNEFFNSLPRIQPRAFGGITAAPDSGAIRIDNVQHQLHAMLLALKYFYPED
jgi:hypothetical protein